MDKAQQKLVDETVNNYLEMDSLKDIKPEIDLMMVALAKYLENDNNYKNFIDNPELVLAEFTFDFIEKHGNKFKRAIELGNELGDAINAT